MAGEDGLGELQHAVDELAGQLGKELLIQLALKTVFLWAENSPTAAHWFSTTRNRMSIPAAPAAAAVPLPCAVIF